MDDTAPREVMPTLQEAHAYFKASSPLMVERVTSDAEFLDTVCRGSEGGYLLVCVDTAGLPDGHYRVTLAKSMLYLDLV